jgi:hypothetical protein
MANQGWIYFLNLEEMASHRIKVRTKETILRKSDYPHLMAGIKEDEIVVVDKRVKPATPRGHGQEHSLVEWIREEMKVGRKIMEGEELVGSYLFDHEPGMVLMGERHCHAPQDQLRHGRCDIHQHGLCLISQTQQRLG